MMATGSARADSSRPAAMFGSRALLLEARDEWCANAEEALAKHGNISNWDVSRVTDMSYIFCSNGAWSTSGCNAACASFNENVENWDTSRVTTLYVRAATPLLIARHPLLPRAVPSHASYAHTTPMAGTCLTRRGALVVQNAFSGASSFNQPLEQWDTSQVTTLKVRAAALLIACHPLGPRAALLHTIHTTPMASTFLA